ncbi:unnamed protein product [Didymodactylos carnosus]|uniref:Uncharacterized protein n=1 Tax=Didymodactylos carnosus TaxID=1234261 RepID=A0A815BPJ4_9BILA|nr:unnamed protein product [Didymodactylos carnosus]CAF4062802.1 unnamed protein product [Didymodactylos carnosus]
MQQFAPYNDGSICSCKTEPTTCNIRSGIFKTEHDDSDLQSHRVLEFAIPGFLVGCYNIEAMFASTFECYYSQSCLNTISNLLYSISLSPFTAMNYSTGTSRYNVTTSIKDIVQQLMVEQWNNKTSFDAYFKRCKPESCVYTYSKRVNLIYVLTTTIGLIGGLTTVLRIFVPFIIKSIRRKKRIVTVSDSDNNGNSFLTSPEWLEIDYNYTGNLHADYPSFQTPLNDFRQIASPFGQLLSSFCQLSTETFDTNFLIFNYTILITPNLITNDQFQLQTIGYINQFVQNTARSLNSSLRIINTLIQSNQFISGLATDSILTIDPHYNRHYDTQIYDYDIQYVYDRLDQEYNSTLQGIECSCQLTPLCVQQAVIYDLSLFAPTHGANSTTVLFAIPGKERKLHFPREVKAASTKAQEGTKLNALRYIS